MDSFWFCGLVVLLTIPDCLSCPLFILFGALWTWIHLSRPICQKFL